MDTRSAVLRLLEENKSSALSGQQIADRLGVTRAAVWKAVRSLINDGYSIEATTNKGYMLSSASDVVSVEGIRAALPERYKDIPLEVKDSTTSTNIDAGIAATNGAPHGATVVALEQKSGQGRLGKSFCSPKGGIYFSTLIRPTLSIEKAVMITPAAAVAVHKAISDVLGLPVSIKWVNDVYMNGRKVVGISTQAQADIAAGGISGIIVGIGINYATAEADFSADIKDKAFINIMSQYTPFGDIAAFRELQRPVTLREYKKVLAAVEECGLTNVFLQDKSSSSQTFIPKWDY